MFRYRLILALAAKDWVLFWADRRAAALAFLVPIILASAFGLVFDKTGPGSGATRLPLLVVVDRDTPFAQRIAQALVASPRVEAEIVTAEVAEHRLRDRRPGLVVVLPDDLASLQTWQPGAAAPRPRLTIRCHPLNQAEVPWADGVVTEVVLQTLAADRVAPLLGGQPLTRPFEVEPEVCSVSTSTGSFNSYTHSFSGMTLQYLLFWGMESGLLLLRERRQSLWLRQRAAPVPLAAVLMGKALATAAIAFLQIVTTFGFGALMFGVSIGGSWLGFLMLALAVSGLSAATGLLVAAIGGTEARARSVCILVILSVSMLGGLWLPSFVLPAWARDLALTLPTTWAMRGLDSVTWQGEGLGSVWPNIAIVGGFTTLFLAVAVARLVSTEARRRRGLA